MIAKRWNVNKMHFLLCCKHAAAQHSMHHKTGACSCSCQILPALESASSAAAGFTPIKMLSALKTVQAHARCQTHQARGKQAAATVVGVDRVRAMEASLANEFQPTCA